MEELNKKQKRADKAAYQKKYRKANQEKRTAYRKVNQEKIAAQQKAYQKANKEEINALNRKWRVDNKEASNAIAKRCRAKMPCGVYTIRSIVDPDKVYIGGSTQIPKRWLGHLSDLKMGKHRSSRLQAHYDEFGKNDLVFSILMLVEEADLVLSEQAFMDELKPYFNTLRAMAEVNYLNIKYLN